MNASPKSLRFALALSLAVVATPIAVLGQEAPAPGPEHRELKQLEGVWLATVKAFGSESKGVATNRVECGGMWLVSDFHGEFAGQKFQGRGLDGYDPQKKKYVSVWVDSMSTRPMLLEGEMNKEKKTLTMSGEGPGPDGKPAKFKSVTHYVDADHVTSKMYTAGPDGGDIEMMTIEYVRKK